MIVLHLPTPPNWTESQARAFAEMWLNNLTDRNVRGVIISIVPDGWTGDDFEHFVHGMHAVETKELDVAFVRSDQSNGRVINPLVLHREEK